MKAKTVSAPAAPPERAVKKTKKAARKRTLPATNSRDQERAQLTELFTGRLIELLDHSYIGERERTTTLARITGCSRGTTEAWVKQESLPDLLSFKRAVIGLRGDPFWLLGLTDSSHVAGAPPRNLAAGPSRWGDSPVSLKALGKGDGGRGWLERSFGAATDAVLLTPMIGDAMSGEIEDGEALAIDESTRSIQGNGIYALERQGRVYIRRVEERMGEGIALLCGNRKYAPVLFDSLEAFAKDGFGVIGRVVGVVKKL